MRRTLAIFSLALALAPAAFAVQLRQVAVVDLPGRPGFEGVAMRGTQLLISHKAEGKLHVFDTAKRRVIATVDGLESPNGVAAAGDRVYVANAGADNIAVISPEDWKVVETIPLNATPFALAATPDGKRLVSANWRDSSLTVIELASGYRQQVVDLPGSPSNLAFANDTIYATLQDRSEIAVVASDGKARTIKLEASQPTGIAATSSGDRIYVAVRFAVVAIDPATGTEVGRVAAPAGVDSLWLDEASGTLYAAANGSVSVIKASGGFAADDEIRADVKGQMIAYDASRGFVYVPGGREGRSKLLILRNVQAQPLLQPREVATNQ